MSHWRNMIQAAGAGGALTAYDALILGIGPLSYYRMDSGPAQIPEPDLGSLGIALNGSATRQVAGALGPATSPNLAMTFGGVGQLMRGTQSSSLPDPADEASLECWIRGTWVSTSRIIAEVKDQALGQSGPHISLRFDTADPFQAGGVGNINARRGNAQIETENLSLNDGNPHHLVLTGPAGSPPAGLKLYIDGSLSPVVSSPSGSAPTGTDRTVLIGNTVSVFVPSTIRFEGDVDECAVYDFELTPTQVLDHFNAGIA